MNYILDLIIIAIVIIAALVGAKKGFANAVIGLVCFIFVLLISFTLSSKLADIIYNDFAQPRIVSAITTSLDSAGFEYINNAQGSVGEIIDTVEKALEQSTFGFVSFENRGEEIGQSILSSTATLSQELAMHLTVNIVKPLFIRMLETILTLLLLIILSLLIKPISLLANKMFSFSIIGTLNKFLGFVSGTFIGVLISAAFAVILNNLVQMNQVGVLGITAQTIEQTYLFKLLISLI